MRMNTSKIKALKIAGLLAFISYLILFYVTAYLFQCFCFNLGSQNPCPPCDESFLGAFRTLGEFVVESNGLIFISFFLNNLLIIGSVFFLTFLAIYLLEKRKQ
ncbi:hypothetical protein A8B79_14745 [Balneola sp. EhC07]|nr:hypothetical protein A8B79_14745 [Balneola sp. EhC07]